MVTRLTSVQQDQGVAQRSPRQAGFTLVELSIVLVIIGLIVGGVLTGQELIKSAEVRSAIGQIEKLNSAVNAFRGRFNALPGDINSTMAASFGLVTRAGTVGRGDGNGLLEGGAAAATAGLGETLLFWRDLSFAGLINGNFVGTDTATAYAATALSTVVPESPLRKGNRLIVYANTGINFFQILSFTDITAAGVYNGAATAMEPAVAYQMDVKLDDGNPAQGALQARGGGANTAPVCTGAAAACCNSTVTPEVYMNANTALACSLRLRMN